MPRPRRHPEGFTATDRKRAARQALSASGGAVRQFELSARAIESIALIRERGLDRTDVALIERLVEAERRRQP